MRILTLFFTIFLYTQLYAQNKTFSGYYITQTGDTIKGIFPNYRQWSQNPGRVEFSDFATSKLSVLTPENCFKFSIENYDQYITYSGPRLENLIEDEQLIINRTIVTFDDQYANIVTFLRLIFKDKDYELYIFSDNKRSNFFYKLAGDSILELKYKKYYDKYKIYDVPEYRQQLMSLFSTQIIKGNLGNSLNKLAYNEKEMVEFFNKLNPSEKPKYKNKNPSAKWIISGGVSVNRIRVKGEESIGKVAKNYDMSISPLVALGYIVPVSRDFNRYFIFPQIKLFTYKNKGEMNDGTFIKTTTFKSDLVITGEVNGGLYAVNAENFQVYFTGGTGMMYLLNSKEVNQRFAGSTNTLYGSYEINLPRMTYTINFSAGISIKKKIFILATYNLPTTIGNFIYTRTLEGIQLRVGYKLNK